MDLRPILTQHQRKKVARKGLRTPGKGILKGQVDDPWLEQADWDWVMPWGKMRLDLRLG